MKYPVRTYARALVGAFTEKPSDAAHIGKRFLGILKRNGDLVNGEKILREAEKLAIRASGGREVEVVSARPLGAKHEKEIKDSFGARDQVRFRTDERLIAGVRIAIDGEQMIDATLKRKLSKLFKQ